MSEKYKLIDSSKPTFITLTLVGWVYVFIRRKYINLLDESLAYCIQNKGLKVHTYLYMTSHIHLIVTSDNDELQDIFRYFKKYTSKKLINLISENGESRKEWLLNKFAFEAKRVIILFLMFLSVNLCAQRRCFNIDSTYSFKVDCSSKKQITSLDLYENKLEEIPVDLIKFCNLRRLCLSRNSLTECNIKIYKLKSLEVLLLGGNLFNNIPNSVYKCKNLTNLNLSYNSINEVSSKIENLSNLKYLILSNNKLTSLPDSISKLEKLEYLKLDGNNFSNEERIRVIQMLPNTKIEWGL